MDTQKGRKHSKLIGATFLKQKYILHEQIHFMIKKSCYLLLNCTPRVQENSEAPTQRIRLEIIITLDML